MKSNHIEVIIQNNSELIKNNSRLAKANRKAIKLAMIGWQKREQLVEISLQIFEALADKNKRTLIEDCWYEALQKAFKNDVENPNDFRGSEE